LDPGNGTNAIPEDRIFEDVFGISTAGGSAKPRADCGASRSGDGKADESSDGGKPSSF
jgi:hypothetical protein